MIDVHLLDFNCGTPFYNLWKDQCFASVKDAPINLHIIPGGINYMERRIEGYKQGNADYVCYIDPDDIVLPGAFEQLTAALSDPSIHAIFTDSVRMDADGSLDFARKRLFGPKYKPGFDSRFGFHNRVHQLAVVRRDIMDQAIANIDPKIKDLNQHVDWFLFQEVALLTDWKYLASPLYGWRQHVHAFHLQSNARKLQVAFDHYKEVWRRNDRRSHLGL